MTQRAPLHVRLPPREWPRELLTWTDGGPQLGIQPAPFIARQSEWPNPVIARPNHELRTWANALPPGVVSTPAPAPVRNYDWPNPTLRVQSFELRTWLHSQQLTPSVVMPFGQSDWPNPQGQRRNQDLLTWIEGLPQTALSLTIPPLNYDWPNPQARAANLELRTWVSTLQLQPPAVQAPFSQLDWQNPAPRPANLELRVWVQGIPYSTLGNPLPPISQNNWPLPPPALVSLERFWSNAPTQNPDNIPPGPAPTPTPSPILETFSGGFLYAYELEQSRRRKKRRKQEELEEDANALKDQMDREIALLLRKQEAEDERRSELSRLQRLVRDHSRNALELSDRAKIAYLRALTQANFSAMEALDRELQRMLEEEEITALMILLNED